MFITSIADRGATPALVKTLVYNQSRLKMIAENVANINTPGYRTKHLDHKAFQKALGTALAERKGNPRSPFRVKVDGEVETDSAGHMVVTPTTTSPENILFHDGTNMSVERQMADLAETGMMNDLITAILRGRYQGLRKAIRGTI